MCCTSKIVYVYNFQTVIISKKKSNLHMVHCAYNNCTHSRTHNKNIVLYTLAINRTSRLFSFYVYVGRETRFFFLVYKIITERWSTEVYVFNVTAHTVYPIMHLFI